MPLSIRDATGRYDWIRSEVQGRAPDQWLAAADLSRRLPPRLSVNSFWEFGRDKPCWSNITVSIGSRIAADLALSEDFASPQVISQHPWEIRMIERGSKWKANTNFELIGESARNFVRRLARGGLASYVWRLYAIRQYAQSLTRQEGVLPLVQALVEEPESLAPQEIFAWTKRFALLAGTGWGATTVNHMLTDLGLSVKPDIHLRRSVIRMGLLDIPSNLPDAEIVRQAGRIDPAAVEAIIRLSRHIAPSAHPQAWTSLREIDKVLMEWSRQGLATAL